MVFILYVLDLPMSTIDCGSLRVIGTVLLEKIMVFKARGKMRHKDTFVHPEAKIHDLHQFRVLGVY